MATGNASIDDLVGGSTLIAMQYSREKLRLRLGVGWGNFNIPVLNFIVPVAVPYPELDLYLLF